MAEQRSSDDEIPVLTEVVVERTSDTVPGDRDMLIAELQTALAAHTYALTEEAVRNAFSEMEAQLFEHVAAKLRRELPELIDNLLREHLEAQEDEHARADPRAATPDEEAKADPPAAQDEESDGAAPTPSAAPSASDFSLAALLGKEARATAED